MGYNWRGEKLVELPVKPYAEFGLSTYIYLGGKAHPGCSQRLSLQQRMLMGAE